MAAWLDEVRALGLFLVPVDEDGAWFRYQQLFAEMLRGELRRREPGEHLRILREASLWYEAHDMPEEAIRHAVASGDALLGARLIVTHAAELTGRGRVPADADLARASRPARPRALPAGRGHGRLDPGAQREAAQARRALRIAERSGFDEAMPDGSASFTSATAIARAALAPDGVENMIVDARRAAALEPTGSAWHAVAQLLEGVAHLLTGATGAANAAFDQAAREGGTDQRPVVSLALGMRSLTAAAAGDWSTAAACASEAGGLVDGDLWGSVTSIPAFTAGRVALHRGDSQHALNQVREAERLYHSPSLAAFPWAAVVAALLLGRLQAALGDLPAARHRLTEARRALALLPTQGVLREQVDTFVNELDAGANDHDQENRGGLTTAELRVLRLLPTHYALGEIGEELGVSRNTVKSQVAAIYRKFGVATRTEAVRRAHEVGLLER